MIYEVCVDSVEGAVAAQQGGAQRVELCDNLVEGGTTPSIGMIQLARRSVSSALNVLIRPRGGDFCYSDLAFQVMCADVEAAKNAGANAVVTGLLLPEGQIDVERTRLLVSIARPMQVTFHRAFDVCRDPFAALETLIELGVERVLTSGQKASALAGADTIARLVHQSAGRITILAGGGINPQNLAILVRKTGVHEVHFSAREDVESPMTFRNQEVKMGRAYTPEEYRRKSTSPERVRQMILSLADED